MVEKSGGTSMLRQKGREHQVIMKGEDISSRLSKASKVLTAPHALEFYKCKLSDVDSITTDIFKNKFEIFNDELREGDATWPSTVAFIKFGCLASIPEESEQLNLVTLNTIFGNAELIKKRIEQTKAQGEAVHATGALHAKNLKLTVITYIREHEGYQNPSIQVDCHRFVLEGKFLEEDGFSIGSGMGVNMCIQAPVDKGAAIAEKQCTIYYDHEHHHFDISCNAQGGNKEPMCYETLIAGHPTQLRLHDQIVMNYYASFTVTDITKGAITLLGIEGAQKGKTITLTSKKTTFGRQLKAEKPDYIGVSDVPTVSRTVSEIGQNPALGWYLTDLGKKMTWKGVNAIDKYEHNEPSLRLPITDKTEYLFGMSALNLLTVRIYNYE